MEKILRFSIISLSLLYSKQLSAQNYLHIGTIDVNAEAQIKTDYFTDLYVYEQVALKKYNVKGELLHLIEDYSNGNISYIDVSDPLKILLFYRDYNEVKILDKTLSELASYSLNDMGFYSVQAIANSRDDNFWVFDNESYTLKKINENGEELQTSERFNLLFSENIQPHQIIDYEYHVFAYDSTKGVFVFDRFGAFQKTIPIKEVSEIQIIQHKILFVEKDMLYSYNLKTLEVQELKIPVSLEKIKMLKMQKDKLYVLSDNKVEIYQISY